MANGNPLIGRSQIRVKSSIRLRLNRYTTQDIILSSRASNCTSNYYYYYHKLRRSAALISKIGSYKFNEQIDPFFWRADYYLVQTTLAYAATTADRKLAYGLLPYYYYYCYTLQLHTFLRETGKEKE